MAAVQVEVEGGFDRLLPVLEGEALKLLLRCGLGEVSGWGGNGFGLEFHLVWVGNAVIAVVVIVVAGHHC